MNELTHLWLIPLLPLAGFLFNGILGRRLPKAVVTAVALLAPLAAFGVVLMNAFQPLAGLPRIEACPQPWIAAAGVHVDFSLVLDPLSLLMLLVITGVGFLIHLYSVGYMAHEEGYARYFAYLNLFLFFMTVLVLADNALLMFVGWEGVGLASYLLIGFYFSRTSAANAGKKAFVVNRIGDFGFLIGIFLLLGSFGTLTFSEIAAKLNAAPGCTGGVLTVIALALLVGATGKSAQLPLYIWLPDAMEGPTPVSALIHAATMVTAGVYMIARTHVLFDHAPFALGVVAVIGAATALFAATIGLVQTDIKRVLAYSTVSQLGYMFLGCGVAAYSAAVFHLMTHAFFKALLFLAAGSVIHGLGGEQDLRKMGGLWRKLPVTFAVTTIGVVAIAGIPPFAGFFSKDAILFAAFNSGPMGWLLWLVGAVTAALTSFYMFRLWYLTFMGEQRDKSLHAHESPLTMLVPLGILALLSVCGGWIGLDRLSEFLAPSVGRHTVEGSNEILFSILAVVIALAGWAVAHLFFRPGSTVADDARRALPFGHKLLLNKYWVDELYGAVIVKPLQLVSRYVLEVLVDVVIVGGLAWLIAGIAQFIGAILTGWQSGNLRSYAAWLAAGAVALLLFLLLPWQLFGAFAMILTGKVAGH